MLAADACHFVEPQLPFLPSYAVQAACWGRLCSRGVGNAGVMQECMGEGNAVKGSESQSSGVCCRHLLVECHVRRST